MDTLPRTHTCMHIFATIYDAIGARSYTDMQNFSLKIDIEVIGFGALCSHWLAELSGVRETNFFFYFCSAFL